MQSNEYFRTFKIFIVSRAVLRSNTEQSMFNVLKICCALSPLLGAGATEARLPLLLRILEASGEQRNGIG
jgi:hypothetical protein